MNDMPESIRRLARDNGLGEPLDRELAASPDVVRNDCAFCHRERSAKDDNHAPNCPYWDFFGGRS